MKIQTAPSRSAAFYYERGLTCAAMEDTAAAIAALREATRLQPRMGAAWHRLGTLLSQTSRQNEAAAAFAQAERHPLRPQPAPNISAAKIARAEQAIEARLREAPPGAAAGVLRQHLMEHPTDFAALRLLAALDLERGEYTRMEVMLHRVLELAPDFEKAQHNIAFVMLARGKGPQAMPYLDRLLARAPGDERYLALRARAFVAMGDYAAAIDVYEAMIRANPRQPSRVWLSYANALKIAGRRADSVRAYRTCLAQDPANGDVYWSIANLKNEDFTEADVGAMRRHLDNAAQPAKNRVRLHFALGRALEQRGDYAGSFAEFAKGAALHRAGLRYSADDWSREVQRETAFFTASFLTAHADSGWPDAAPIFIVGLPRAGSTLVEQILASHSLVEGTRELPEIMNIVRDLTATRGAYPACLGSLDAGEIAALGRRYIENTGVFRKTDRPFFVDKMPANWLYAPFIRLILPNAKIIDVRRQPMAAGFAVFKQLFGYGAHFSYDLEEIGRHYSDYAAFMAHCDAIMPGKVHRVQYETLVQHTAAEIRLLLAYCGLEFEPGCLRFWENKRAVGTPSAEQVRQPIFRDALDHWRNYEPWLAPLREALSLMPPG